MMRRAPIGGGTGGRHMARLSIFVLVVVVALLQAGATLHVTEAAKSGLRVGVAAIPITPFGRNPDWDGTITDTGVWGERFTDSNRNGRWDEGEPFEDDPGNTAIDASSKDKYDGIFLAGFGNNRLATGKHDDYWARALVLEYGKTKLAIVSIDVLGYYSKASYYGLAEIQKLVDPKAG